MIFTPPSSLSQTVTLSQTPSPLWSVTYFMDGPYGSENSVILINKRVPMGQIFDDNWATLGYSSFCL